MSFLASVGGHGKAVHIAKKREMAYQRKERKNPVCLECGGGMDSVGRSDRKFCCEQCKNRYNNRKSHEYRGLHMKVLRALDKNHEILDNLLRSKITSIDLGDLALLGYDLDFSTSYRKNGIHSEYRCFDIKFLCTDKRIFKISKFSPSVSRDP